MSELKLSVQDLVRYQDAQYLLQCGLRTRAVHLATGISEEHCRKIYTHIHGTRPPSGKTRALDTILSANRHRHLEVSLYILIYTVLADDCGEEVDYLALPGAHKEYLQLRDRFLSCESRPLDINDGYVISRDYRSGILWLHPCGACGHNYVQADHSRVMPASCPWCGHGAEQHLAHVAPLAAAHAA